MQALRYAGVFVLALTIGAVAFCCGPKVKPEAGPTCPGDKYEVCEHDKLGAHSCFCPEE